jgi:hypothetical protein
VEIEMTTKLATLIALGLLGSVPVQGAAAQALVNNAPVMLNPNFTRIIAPQFTCQIYLGVHIALQNVGVVTIPAGTTVHWSLQSGPEGYHVLAVPLPPGGAMLIENALAGVLRGAAGATPCLATVV